MEGSPEASTQTPPIHHQPTHPPNTDKEKEREEKQETKDEDAAAINGGDMSREPPRETDDEEFDDLDLRNEPEHQPKGPQEINQPKDPDLKDEPKQQEQQHQRQHQPEDLAVTPRDTSPEKESSDFDESGAKTTSNSTCQSTEIDQIPVLHPHSHLPKPLAPPGLHHQPHSPPPPPHSNVPPFPDQQTSGITGFLRRRLSSLKEPEPVAATITEFRITNVKVIVELKKDQQPKSQSPQVGGFMGRITFFSRSNCRDCGAVRSFLRERRLPYVEINVDVFPSREEELRRRTGKVSVPQIFFNEKLVGGLVALNSLRNSGEFEGRLVEMAGERCGEGAPPVPVYGFDEEVVDEEEDGLVEVVRVVRKRVKVKDSLRRMKLVRCCFEGRELVEVLIHHLDCGRKKAVEVGKELLRKHFVHHVFREMDFEDGNNLYRFLEHDPMVPKCYNFRVTTNDYKPKPAYAVGQRITKLMFAILEAYASEDRRHLDYRRISLSEEFRRCVNAVHDLQRVDLFALSTEERLTFFLNLYNAMAIHAVIRIGRPEAITERRAFFNDFHYMIGGYPYSLSTIRNGILRSNSKQPYSIVKPFAAGDKRLELALPKVNPLIHFGLCNATRSSPAVQFFSSQGVEVELRQAAREFLQNGGMEVDLEKRTVYLTKLIRWFSADFPQDKELLKWILSFTDATKAGFLIHLLSDGGPIHIVYQNYDWSLNV